MAATDRRTFLKLLGAPALSAALPVDFEKILAIPAHDKTRSIRDVEHVIVLMQENRSFDHYVGTLRGVRGFNDPHPVTLPSGKPVWYQPNGATELLPFRPPVKDVGQTFLPDPPHGWNDTHGAWNGGRHDGWVPNKGVTTMTYAVRDDLPYLYALADAFTVCDNYHASLLGPTDPNRYHMWTGWVGNDGTGGGPVISNAEAGYDWSTYPERLQRAGITWRIYQDIGNGLTAAGTWGWTKDPFIGNFGDNSLLYFHQYQKAAPGSLLAERAKTGTDIKDLGRRPERLFDEFRRDVQNGTLPEVSWIVAPEAYSEHPNWEPDFGTWYVSQIISILAANPDVWSRTALFLTYDEEGGFFDHLVPPTPPPSSSTGRSTVPTTNELFPGNADNVAGPYGLGMRVPMIVVSPWTRGGWVNSQVFDHTSLIKFLETRFAGRGDVREPNITPWRRAVVGDLTSAFDFRTPNRSRLLPLPDTADLRPTRLVRRPDQVPTPPADQRLPRQERGVRRARAIPYVLHASGTAQGSAFRLDLRNSGEVAAVFHVRSVGGALAPRSYTVGVHEALSDTLPLTSNGHHVTVHGPNGFYRSFQGSGDPGRPALEVTTTYHHSKITLHVTNPTDRPVDVRIHDGYGGLASTETVRAGRTRSRSFRLHESYGWYDLTVTARQDRAFRAQLAGHVENGKDSISDPLMGGLV